MQSLIGKVNLTLKNIILIAFAVIEIAIYIIFNVLAAIRPHDPIYLKYSGVLLCFAVAVIMVFLTKAEKDAIFIASALLFTSVSDLFILVLDDFYEVGLATFIITQSIYFCRMYAGRFKKAVITAVVRAALSATLIIVMACVADINFLIVEASIYIVMLVCNVTDAFILCGRGVNNILFALGLLLFLCCDICVGLHNGAMVGMDLSKGLKNFVGFAIWAFYMPSQVLIVFSMKKGWFSGKKVEEDERKTEESA